MDPQLKALSRIVELLPKLGVAEIKYLIDRLQQETLPIAEEKHLKKFGH